MDKILVASSLMLLPQKLVPSTLFAPDSDTALLFELVTTTAAQLNELEQLVTNAEKLTGNLQKYNEIVTDHWYRAQRIAHLAENLSTLSSTKIENLGGLNSAIRELKDNITELEDLMVEYGMVRVQSEKISKAADKNDLQIIKEGMLADIQIERAHATKTLGNVQKVNAQANAYANKNLVDLKNQSNQQLKLLSTRNEMVAKEKEEELKRQVLRREFYQLDRVGPKKEK